MVIVVFDVNKQTLHDLLKLIGNSNDNIIDEYDYQTIYKAINDSIDSKDSIPQIIKNYNSHLINKYSELELSIDNILSLMGLLEVSSSTFHSLNNN